MLVQKHIQQKFTLNKLEVIALKPEQVPKLAAPDFRQPG